MMVVRKFGERIRELRKKAGMNQREVASKVGINFTYLSKIESGVMSPPREDKIIKLAKVLNADKDELITLAGKIPSDLASKLRTEGIVPFLRSSSAEEIKRFLKERGWE